MDVKGQGALEYLLLIGGAVLVAAIVIALITGIPGTVPSPNIAARCGSHAICAECQTDTDCSAYTSAGTVITSCTTETFGYCKQAAAP